MKGMNWRRLLVGVLVNAISGVATVYVAFYITTYIQYGRFVVEPLVAAMLYVFVMPPVFLLGGLFGWITRREAPVWLWVWLPGIGAGILGVAFVLIIL